MLQEKCRRLHDGFKNNFRDSCSCKVFDWYFIRRKSFREQVLDKLTNDDQRVVAEFPENVEDVSTSFVLGMYSDLKKKYGSTKALQMMTLYSSCQDLNNKLQKIIDVYGLSGNS